MVCSRSDRLRQFELLLLALGAVSVTLLLASNAREGLGLPVGGSLPALPVVMYVLKLLLMKAALLTPFVVLVLLGRVLLREAPRTGFRWLGLGVSATASAGVLVMLLASLISMDLAIAFDTPVGEVVPAIVLLSVCVLLYGGLIRLAQKRRIKPISADGCANGRQSP